MSNPFIVAEDAALKSYLSGMTVGDEKSATRPVKVRFGYPDVEIGTQEFPFITIDLVDILPANDRQTSGKWTDNDYRGTVAPANGFLYTYDVPVAYDLVYQLTTHARHPRHDRSILFQMWTRFPSKFGKLPVRNQLNTETSVRSMFVDGFVKRDTYDSADSGNRRLLRNVFTIRIVSEMTPYAAANRVAAAQEVVLNENNSYIPLDYTIVQ